MSRSVSGTTAPTPCSSHSAAQRRHVGRVVDQRHRDAVVRGVLRGRERVRVGGDDRRVLGEGGDDVVALADAGEEDALQIVRVDGPLMSHPPVSPL